MPIRSAAALALLLLPLPVVAQETVHIPVVEPLPADVESIDGIVSAWYEVVSGPIGQPRDWGRDATLYREPIFFTIVGMDEAGRPTVDTVTKQEYVNHSDRALVEHGFVEREIHRETRRFGAIAHVWSTYEWSEQGGGSGRGINSIQLFHDGARWWITHATWDNEREGVPIPAEYLP